MVLHRNIKSIYLAVKYKDRSYPKTELSQEYVKYIRGNGYDVLHILKEMFFDTEHMSMREDIIEIQVGIDFINGDNYAVRTDKIEVMDHIMVSDYFAESVLLPLYERCIQLHLRGE